MFKVEAMEKGVETRRLMQRAGFDARILSGGSTGTYNIDSTIDGVTELQVGSYVFMDVDYRRIGGADGQTVYADFQPSLTVLTTVTSRPRGRVAILDIGRKTVTAHHGRPEIVDRPGATMMEPSEEHWNIDVGEWSELRPGDRLTVIPGSLPTTVNLHDRMYVCRNSQVEAIWPIAARGRAQ